MFDPFVFPAFVFPVIEAFQLIQRKCDSLILSFDLCNYWR